jgi:hypothetical protein
MAVRLWHGSVVGICCESQDIFQQGTGILYPVSCILLYVLIVQLLTAYGYSFIISSDGPISSDYDISCANFDSHCIAEGISQ